MVGWLVRCALMVEFVFVVFKVDDKRFKVDS